VAATSRLPPSELATLRNGDSDGLGIQVERGYSAKGGTGNASGSPLINLHCYRLNSAGKRELVFVKGFESVRQLGRG
jgi:hypothetical protein